MNHGILHIAVFCCLASVSAFGQERARIVDQEVRQRCIDMLRDGLRSDEFWPSIHAAEALTLNGHAEEVRSVLEPKLDSESDDQRRCGLARELVRAGDIGRDRVMIEILRAENRYGHVHAAESLYKVGWEGDSEPLRRGFDQEADIRLRIMSAAALAKHGEGEEQRDALKLLRSVMRNEMDGDIFRLAAWVLGRVGTQEDISLIRGRLSDSKDPLTIAFLQHALALLGDPQGRETLLSNLDSSDAGVRTYAAVFAGEADIVEAAPKLIEQLDDENLDARLRAAQALLAIDRRN